MPNFFTYTSAMNILWFLLILTGTWAEVPPIDKYGLKGGLVCLAVEESPGELKELKWRFESDVIVDDKEISPKYKEKVDYNPVNHSLCIKNLKETDSGTYIETVGKWNVSPIIKYKVTIQEAVSMPVMKVVSLSSNSSTGQCKIAVNCSVKDVWVLSVCYGVQCTLSQQSLSLTGVNITISNDNNTIQCTGKNHVSAETNSERMKDICIEKDGKASKSQVGIIVSIIAGSIAGGLLFVIVFVGIRWIISTRRRSHEDQQPLQVNTVRAPQGEMPGPQNTGRSEVTSIYVTIGKPGAAGVELPPPEEMPDTQSESLYSTVQQPAAEECHLVDKVGAPKEVRPEPQSPSEAKPTSIYSTVQKPPAAQRRPVDKEGNNLNKPDRTAQ
ncbi:SLAM family member 7 [Coregonus clupeaformis]|uniref:SLAM family member 7 n=1 Tax=Coregonus clupeaformis TaxID=59861 RepID=UPI001E1C360F|nr:SLAM family member 7 [Coregonus clupeaformis]